MDGDGATILHADLDAFYASVEQRDDPRLRGRPVIVAGGVVLAASWEARAYGVRTAMSERLARQLCPEAVVVPPRMSAYAQASRAVFEVFRRTTPLVEGISIDEAFLDVGGLRRLVGPPVEVARRLRQAVRTEVGLPISVGVARTKFLAKMASRLAKPDGLLVVPPEEEAAFLHPLPVETLWGVGPVTADILRRYRVTTVAQVARLGEAALVSMLGEAAGRHLYALSQLRDPRPVRVSRSRGSYGAQRALGRGPHSAEDLRVALAGLVDRVTRRMRAAGRSGRTVTLHLRFADYRRASRSRTLPHPTAGSGTVLSAALDLLTDALPLVERRGVTLIGVAVGNLSRGVPAQPTLPFTHRCPDDLDAALDAVRDRYGSRAVVRAAALGRDPGLSVPVLPD